MAPSHVDTTHSNQFFQDLIKQFERKKVADKLGITQVHLWRLCHRNHPPSKKIITKLVEWRQTSQGEIEQLIRGKKRTVPECSYPNIRAAVTQNSLFDNQKDPILFSTEITETEKFLITYYYLIKLGVKSLDNHNEFEVLSKNQQEKAISLCEKQNNLIWDLRETLGCWWKWESVYYLKNCSQNGEGLTFLESLEELILRKKVKDYCIKALKKFKPQI